MSSLLPTNDQCKRVIDLLQNDPALTEWEEEFVDSNRGRSEFSDKQKESVKRLMEKYECN